MKPLLALLTFLALTQAVQAQYVYTIKADSVKLTGASCDSTELILLNHTQAVPGFLFNPGNGRTKFVHALQKLNDSTYLVGADTLKLIGHIRVGPLDSLTGSLNGLTVAGQTLIAESATSTTPGLVNLSNQTMGQGTKTFQSHVVLGVNNTGILGETVQNTSMDTLAALNTVNHARYMNGALDVDSAGNVQLKDTLRAAAPGIQLPINAPIFSTNNTSNTRASLMYFTGGATHLPQNTFFDMTVNVTGSTARYSGPLSNVGLMVNGTNGRLLSGSDLTSMMSTLTYSPKDRKSTRLNSSHQCLSRMPSSA